MSVIEVDQGETELTLNHTREADRGELAYYIVAFLNMLTSQAEVKLGWQLMWNFRCNKISWLWQLAQPAVTSHAHVQSNAGACSHTLELRCL